jgi:predicted ATPase
VVEQAPSLAPLGPPEPEAPLPVAPPPQAYERLMHRLHVSSAKEGPQADVAADLTADLNGWLPAPLAPLLGRDDALAQTQRLLPAARCLTLTGAGGSGKTRLALALAEAVRLQYPGGTWWVGLDALADPALLPDTVARAVGGTDLRQPALRALAERLAGRRALLVLDNCEHLVDGCAELAAELLRQLPQLQLLATSRESLRVPGEVVWTVPPLDVPDTADEPVEQLGRHASVRLLVDRIARHSPGFALGPDNAASLARICRGLEGLPLALELVAAQVGPQTPAQVAARLDDSLALLRVGARGGMRHHQTMAAAVDWGWRLLGGVEQQMALRLSVFLGGWTAESAAAACDGLGVAADELPERLGRLLRASMVLAAESGGTVRFRMLEPIRQFAFARLEASGQVDAVRRQLLAWYGERCRLISAQLAGPHQVQGYAFLVPEFDNLRALLAWSRPSDIEAGLRLATDLWRFWQVKGHAQEMLAWFDEVLGQAPQLPDALRADACNAAGVMARTCGQYAAALRLHEAGLALQRRLGNRRGEAIALNNLCVIARDQLDHDAVQARGSACLSIARAIGERNLEGLALMHLGTALRGQDRLADAEASFRQSVAILSELGEKRALGTLQNFLGHLALAGGRQEEAERCFEDSLALNRELEDFWGLGIASCNLALLHRARGDDATALQWLRQSLAHYRRAGARHGLEACFELLARIARQRGQLPRAAWCWGVVEQIERDVGKVTAPAARAQRDAELQALQTALPDEGFDAARAEGRQVALDEAFAAVLRDEGLR